MHRLLPVGLLILAASAPAAARAAAASPPPNIILILADDFGIDSLGCYGGDSYPTPAIDRLAREGMRFTRAFATPVCGPSRAQLITGQYPFRNGAIEIDRTMAAATPQHAPSLPLVLKRGGYVTGMTGKWRQMRLDPGDWGFDENLASPTAGGHYMTTTWTVNGRRLTAEKERYFPGVMHEYALDFIERHQNQPFFFYYALTNPHTPIVPTPDSKPGVTDRRQLYADNIAYIDKLVGDVVAHLEKLGLRKQTLVLFTGDNGSERSGQGTVRGRRLAGWKATMAEGGSHVPLVANWPAVIPAGSVCADLVDFSDLLPTLAEIAAVPLPADQGVLDGRSFAPQLRGMPGTPRDWVFVQLGHYYFVRNQDWRLDELGRLHDMREAPFAETLLPADSTDPRAQAARRELQSVLAALRPEAGPTWDQWTGFTLNNVRHRGAELPRPDGTQ